MNVDAAKFYQLIKTPIYFVVVAYALMWSLENRNFYLTFINLKWIVSGLFIYALFVNTEKAKVDLNWWVHILLFALIGLLSTHGSVDYLISSIKVGMDFYIYCLGFMLYVIFNNQLRSFALPTLLIIVLSFVAYSAPATLAEIINQIPSENRGQWGSGFALTTSIELSFYEHLRMYSFHAFIASCCAFILLKHSKESVLLLVIYSLLFAICFFGLLIGYGRGSLLAFIAFVVFDAFLLDGVKKAITAGILVVLLIFASYSVLYFTPVGVVSEFLFSSFIRSSGAGDGALGANAISSGRLDMWMFALQKALESPVYGHGSSSAVWLFNGTGYAYASQPHNAIVQFIMDFGYLGAAVFCFLMFRVLKPFFVQLSLSHENEPLRRSLVSFVIAYLLYALTDGLFYHPYPMLHFSIIVAILAAVHWHIQEAQKS